MSKGKALNRSIIIPASHDFEPGVRAFLNSFDFYHPDTAIKVYLLNYNLHQSFLDEQNSKFKFLEIIDLETPFADKAWACKLERFNFAGSLSGIVMMCDADLFFCSNIDHWFDIAGLGYIVASSNGSNIRYHAGWREKNNIDIPDMINYKTICSVPTILDIEKHGEIWESIYEHKLQKGFGADFDLINIFMVKYDKLDFILPVPTQQTTGIHHFMLKLDTRVKRVEGRLITTDGLPVLMVHGKWWREAWVKGLMKPMYSYAKGREDIIKGAEESVKTLTEEFNIAIKGGYNAQ